MIVDQWQSVALSAAKRSETSYQIKKVGLQARFFASLERITSLLIDGLSILDLMSKPQIDGVGQERCLL